MVALPAPVRTLESSENKENVGSLNNQHQFQLLTSLVIQCSVFHLTELPMMSDRHSAAFSTIHSSEGNTITIFVLEIGDIVKLAALFIIFLSKTRLRLGVSTESEVPDVELSDLSTPGLARMEAAAPVVLVLPQVDQATRPHHGNSVVSGEWS